MFRSRFKGLALLGVLALVACSQVMDPFKATSIEGSPFAMHWSLTNQEGGKSDGQEFKGKISVIYFGYTSCPDICFTTLNRVQDALKILASQQIDLSPLEIIFISVDSEDSPAVMKNYLEHFGPQFVGLSGSESDIQKAVQDFKVYVEKKKSARAFEHSGYLYVFDRAEKPRLLISPELKASDIAHDLQLLLSERR